MYNLERLGWHSFQQLCLTVLREILGQIVESYLNSRDGGRDAFSGTWKTKNGEDLTGRFVFQCKFIGKQNYQLKASDLKDEYTKAEKLLNKGLCDSYILITNAGVSGQTASEIELDLILKQFELQILKEPQHNWMIQDNWYRDIGD